MKLKFFLIPLFLALFLYGWSIRNGSLSFHPRAPTPTQLTNNTAFLKVCKKALEQGEDFHHFKQNPIYTLFYENATFEEGKEALVYLREKDPKMLRMELLEKIRRLECVGDPLVFNYEPIGPFSATTLVYLKVASELKGLVEADRPLRITEIGGNGGLCKVLHEVFCIEQYTLVDLEEGLHLAEKYLEALDVKGVQFLTPDQLKLESCDLLISQQGFAESNFPLQKKYIRKLFSGAEVGYVCCRYYPKNFGIITLNVQELKDRLNREKLPFTLEQESRAEPLLTWKRT